MAHIIFPSIESPTWRYRISNGMYSIPSCREQSTEFCIDQRLSQYDTMGDGETQHSPDILVRNERIVDLVHSLVCHLRHIPIDLQNGRGGISTMHKFWYSTPAVTDRIIEFARDLKYNEKKATYYTLRGDCKKSHSDSKRHDRRWSRLNSFGEQESEIGRVLRIIYCDGNVRANGIIQSIATTKRVAEILQPNSPTWILIPELKYSGSVFRNLTDQEMLQFLNWFEAITNFRDSTNTLSLAINCSESYALNAARKEPNEQPV